MNAQLTLALDDHHPDHDDDVNDDGDHDVTPRPRPRPPLSDQAARDRMADDVGVRVIAIAGAGSGKTTQLVARVRSTLSGTATAAPVPPSQVAVITFTDKAARELVHRFREVATGPIDDAYVGTIHGFCASILRSFPIEAGLPPKFSTADEITSRADAEARARRIVSAVYDLSANDTDLREALGVVAAHVGLHALPSIVAVIDRRWDQFRHLELELGSADDLPRLHRALLDAGEAFLAGRPNPGKTVTAFADWLAEQRATPVTLASAVRISPPPLARTGGAALADERDAIKAAGAELAGAAKAIVLRRVVAAFQPLVLRDAERRLADGRLGYDDLLVLTRQLLATRERVRTELRRRYQRVFVDEFQDTDRVQYEIVRLLTDPEPGDGAAGSPRLFAVGDPKQSIYGFRQAEVELFGELADDARAAGHLAELTANFRTRADVAAWINTVMSRRFAEPLISPKKQSELGMPWPPPVTVAYEPLAAERPATLPTETAPGPAVVLLGVEADDDGGPRARCHDLAEHAQRAEAADIVGVAQRAIDEQWRVLDADPHATEPGSWVSRPAKRSDIAVLVARRTGLGELEETLRRAGIPYRIEGGTLAYDRREVYELLHVARAVANPADELRLVTALRTSILGCSDTDLFAYRHRQPGRGGTWRTQTGSDLPDAPEPGDDGELAGVSRVRRALAQIDAWARDAHRRGPAALLAEIYDWSMGAAAAQFEGAHMVSETWRRVRYLIDEARAWFDQTGGTLIEYLAWVADKVETVERSEIAPDETDEDAIRILTIHAAKGLEFPIVVVAGLGTKDNFMSDQFRAVVDGDDVELKLGGLATAGFPARDEIAAWAEEARLLYVAMTRTRDHLVLSCHTSKRSTPNPVERLAGHLDLAAAECWSAGPAPEPAVGEYTIDELRAVQTPRPVTDDELPPRPAPDRRTIWTPSALAARDHDFAEGAPAEQGGVDDEAGDDAGPEATAIPLDAIEFLPADPGLQRDPAPGLEALRSRGRYGTDAGKAVHEVMQRVDLADPHTGLQALVDAACDNVDLVDADQRERVGILSRSIIDSALFARMRDAAVCEREIYVGAMAEVDGAPATIWGYADAVFLTDAGTYAVVDFKTDSSATTDDELRDRYRAQLNAYAEVIERATSTPVDECWLLVGRMAGPAAELSIARR